ncbi:AraC family transcriptional regulator [Alloscardovia macacae]|uniref:Xylose operon regulator n=1 Tax=Alloscardovia macacae TaxID=1160091 RepID=A0A261F7D2_9BIFI|nr:AraC family transcriptional regulator [Alloscardovia macacae]OZG54943.1 xylose operon regulator [Alloscardovia macacae]
MTESFRAYHPSTSPSALQSKGSVRLGAPDDHAAPMQILDESRGPFRIVSITAHSHSAYSASHIVENHWHAALEVVATLVGHSHHYIDGREYIAQPGDVFVISPYSFHSVIPDITTYVAYPDDTPVAIVLHIGYQYMDYLIPNLASSVFQVRTDDPSLREREAAILRELLHLQNPSVRTVYTHILEGSLTNELLYLLCSTHLQPERAAISTSRHKHIARLQQIIEYTDEHYTERLSQQMVAQKFHFSKEYFARFFKDSTGLTYMDYLSKKRCSLAAQLLTSTDESLTSIAQNCGFSDARGLILHFKKEYHITPHQYRKQQTQHTD